MTRYEREESARMTKICAALAFVIGLAVAGIAKAEAAPAILDLELSSPAWAKETVVELGTCEAAPRGQLQFGKTLELRAIPASTQRYSIARESEQPVCIRVSWHADGIEVLSPETAVALPRVTVPGAFQLLAAQTIIRITAIPTGSGVVSSKYRDGIDTTPAIPLTWLPLPSHINEIEGAAASYSLCSSLTQAGSPDATVTLVGAPSGWSVVNGTTPTCTLAYSGTGTSAPTSTIARATRNAAVSDSLPFSLAATAPDIDTCITGFTCAAFSGASCDFTAIDSNTQEIEHTGPGACATYKSFSSESNRNFAVDVKSGATFNTANFSGGGVFIMGGTNWDTSYLTQLWWPKTGQARLRTNDNATALSQNCAAGTALSQGLRIVYDASTDEQSGAESENNTTYTQCGAAINDGAITSGLYGIYVQGSSDVTNPTTMTFDVVTDNTTLPGGTSPPPPPPASSLVTNFPGGPPWATGAGQLAGTGTSFDSNVASLENWLGLDRMDMYVCWVSQSGDDMIDWNTWKDQITTSACTTALARLPKDTTLVIAYPPFPRDADPGVAGAQNNKDCAHPELWDRAEAGDYDAYLASMTLAISNQYKAARPADPTGKFLAIRWGWEHTGAWYSWSMCNKTAEWKAYWHKMVQSFRGRLADIKFDVSPARTKPRCAPGGGTMCNPRIALSEWMPPASEYDTITRSNHNENDGEVTSVADFVVTHVDSNNNNYGLDEICDYAVADGKKCGMSEWGTNTTGAPASCGVIPSNASQQAFIQGTYNWLVSRCPSASSCNIGWEATLSTGCQGQYNHQSAPSSILFQSLWSGSVLFEAERFLEPAANDDDYEWRRAA